MQKYNGNVSRAALAAGKERRELGKLLKKYQIDPNQFRLPLPTVSLILLAHQLGQALPL
jgi:hypothetical protein